MPVKIADIQRVAAEYFEVSPCSMTSHHRQHHIAQPRMIAMVVAREMTNHSLPEIAKIFGRADHSAVIHAMHRVNNSRYLRDLADRLKDVVEAAPRPDRTVKWIVRSTGAEQVPVQ